MKWEGAKEFREMNMKLTEFVRVESARALMEISKVQRDRALEGFTTYGIRLITGRSRALYTVKPGEGMFQPGWKVVHVDVGYNDWPKNDSWSPEKEIAFYPFFLNYGTVHMTARPFHTVATEATEPEWWQHAQQALDRGIWKFAQSQWGG